MPTVDLFGSKPRRSPRVMMHVVDAGGDGSDSAIAVFRCMRCGHETDWLVVESITEGKRGVPCPSCNGGNDA